VLQEKITEDSQKSCIVFLAFLQAIEAKGGKIAIWGNSPDIAV
jgi:anti-anti-sigma regulatory factor